MRGLSNFRGRQFKFATSQPDVMSVAFEAAHIARLLNSGAPAGLLE